MTFLLQGFRLGSNIASKKATEAQRKQEAAATVNKSLLSIDYASEYHFMAQFALIFMTLFQKTWKP